jgi:hypothetical protein
MNEGQNEHQDMNGKARKRGSFFQKPRSRRASSYEERKSDILAAQQELSDLYHQDEDSTLFDMLDSMLFGKIYTV